MAEGERVAPSVPKGELPASLAYVLVMFFGFAHAYIAPNTWFGRWIGTGIGMALFLVLPPLIIASLRNWWLNYRRSREGNGQ